jgi:hypothetical protein
MDTGESFEDCLDDQGLEDEREMTLN